MNIINITDFIDFLGGLLLKVSLFLTYEASSGMVKNGSCAVGTPYSNVYEHHERVKLFI